MNPLIRERMRRRRIATRLGLLVTPLILTTAGIAVPAIARHREASNSSAEALARFDEQIRTIADLVEFKRRFAEPLASAELRMASLIGAGPLPIDFRNRLRGQLEATGARVISIEIAEVDSNPSADEDGSTDAPTDGAFDWSRAFVEVSAAYGDIPTVLGTFEQSLPNAIIEHVDLRREENRLDRVIVRCDLAFPTGRNGDEEVDR